MKQDPATAQPEADARATRDYGLTGLRAGTSAANKASRTVLERTGFVQVGDPTTGDRPQVFYTRRLDGRAV